MPTQILRTIEPLLPDGHIRSVVFRAHVKLRLLTSYSTCIGLSDVHFVAVADVLGVVVLLITLIFQSWRLRSRAEKAITSPDWTGGKVYYQSGNV